MNAIADRAAYYARLANACASSACFQLEESGNRRWAYYGDGVQTNFIIDGAGSINAASYIVAIDGVLQDPENYTIASGTPFVLAMSVPVPSGSEIVIVVIKGLTGATGPSGGPTGATGATGLTSPAGGDRWAYTSDGSTLIYNINGAISTMSTAFFVAFDGVSQDPNNYSITAGSPYTITFSTAPASGVVIVIVSLNGIQGNDGATGATGVAGSNGATGSTGATGLSGDKYTTSSTTTLTIATGTQSLTVDTGLALSIGQPVIIANTFIDQMSGDIVSYNPLTGALVANITSILGSGTFSNWSVSLFGAVGPIGTTGATGATGLIGATGPQGATGILPTSNFGNAWAYTGDGIQTVFAITGGLSILAPAYLVHVDGVYQKSTNYTIDNVIPRTLTFSIPIPSGSEITIVSLSVA